MAVFFFFSKGTLSVWSWPNIFSLSGYASQAYYVHKQTVSCSASFKMHLEG